MTAITIVNNLTAGSQVAADTETSTDATMNAVDLAGLEFKIINESTSPGVGKVLEIFWAWSDTEVFTDIATTLSGDATHYTLSLEDTADATYYFREYIAKNGDFFNLWITHSTLDAPVRLSTSILYPGTLLPTDPNYLSDPSEDRIIIAEQIFN